MRDKILLGFAALIMTAIAVSYLWDSNTFNMQSLVIGSQNQEQLTQNILDELAPFYTEELLSNLHKVGIIEVTRKKLHKDSKQDVIAKLVSDGTCGSAGCIHELFIQKKSGKLERIKFGLTVHTLTFVDTFTDGMRDLYINDNPETQMIWNGSRYIYK